ncbi:tyrosine-type recombinase/integrase [Catelliglobosispora koreensis]|uniref:tyrosine-type recombinase/integrase n=1 Tax=Catelliglobosispora koreensis TaxID=129052 RepID=UPI00037B28AD|nr:site-specific integrase [Catelliglobosispora koreensis]
MKPANKPTITSSSLDLTHKVKIWKIQTRKGKRRDTYRVRWETAGVEQWETFHGWSLADSFRAELIRHARAGEAFDIGCGLPVPMIRNGSGRSWYEHLCQFMDAKWNALAPNSRRSLADAMASTIEPHLTGTATGRPSVAEVRQAVYLWVANSSRRKGDAAPPAELLTTVRWLEQHTVGLDIYRDRQTGPDLARRAHEALATLVNGERASANTVGRRRAAYYNVLEYAVESGQLDFNPVSLIKWKLPKARTAIDPTSVISLELGLRLLGELARMSGMGRRLVAFFGLMMFAALRPAEVIGLRASNIIRLPDDGWGSLRLRRSTPTVGTDWTDSGAAREDRSLKHRAVEETRLVPLHPILVQLLKQHLQEFGHGADGHVFVGPRGGIVHTTVYLEVWHIVRQAVLTPEQLAEGVCERPYDLRHFALSYWLRAGVSVVQAALWAGNSAAVIWAIYAKVMLGEEAEAQVSVAERVDKDLAALGLSPAKFLFSATNRPQIPVDDPAMPGTAGQL